MKLHPAALCLVSLLVASPASAQSAGDDMREPFGRFVAAQNAHDLKAVESLLSDSPGFLWITKGNAIWGRSESLKRFDALFHGTWHLQPEDKDFRVVFERPDVAQIFVPIVFSIGPAGQAARDTRFLMNQTWVRGDAGWKLMSILPIPVPPPVSGAPAKPN